MPKREQLEEMLKADPDDVFLQYALAMAYASEGDVAEGINRLRQLIRQHPDYVAAYFQCGQLLSREGEADAARDVLEQGIQVADRVGDQHAAMEMRGFLDTL